MRKLIFQDLTSFAMRVACGLLSIVQSISVMAGTPVPISLGYEVSEPVISMKWVDNNRFVFAGSKSENALAGTPRGPMQIYVWNEASKSVQFYTEATRFCMSGNEIAYVTKLGADGKSVRKVGPFGSEKESSEVSMQKGIFGKFTCRIHSFDELKPKPPRSVAVVLAQGDGYIGLGPTDVPEFDKNPRALALLSPTRPPVMLPISADEDIEGGRSRSLSFSVFRNAYVVVPRLLPSSGVGGHWPYDQPRIVYLIWSDGKVEKVSFPASAGFVVPRPIKQGWIYGSGRRQAAGLYLYDGKYASRLEVGGINEIAVSPDGCIAMVAITNREIDKVPAAPVRLKRFNFCSGRN